MPKKVSTTDPVATPEVKPKAKKAPAKRKVAKKAPAKQVSKPKVQKRTVMHANDVHEAMPKVAHVCRSCHALPAGSIELVSMLLVLVFALSAVLITSVYALNQKTAEVEQLQAQFVQAIDVTQ